MNNSYDNINPFLNLDFRNSLIAPPELAVTRVGAVRVLNNPKEYVEIPSNAPQITYDEKTKSPLGLCCDATRSQVIANSFQGMTNLEDSGGTFTVIAEGAEDGIHYKDFRIVSNFENGYCTKFPFGMTGYVTGDNTLSVYLKKISGDFSNVPLYLRVRHANWNIGQYVESSTAPINLNEATGNLINNRYILHATAKPGLTNPNSMVLFEFISRASLNHVLRIGMPQWEEGLNATAPLWSGITKTTRAATKYHITSLSNKRNKGCIFADFTIKNAENKWQDIFVLSDSLLSFQKACGLSLTSQKTLSFSSGLVKGEISAQENTRYKVAINWGSGDCDVCINGQVVATLSGDTEFTPQSLHLGSTINSSGNTVSNLTGTIGAVKIYPDKLSREAMKLLTKI